MLTSALNIFWINGGKEMKVSSVCKGKIRRKV